MLEHNGIPPTEWVPLTRSARRARETKLTRSCWTLSAGPCSVAPALWETREERSRTRRRDEEEEESPRQRLGGGARGDWLSTWVPGEKKDGGHQEATRDSSG
jgi:hypothetical protein